MAVKPRLPKDLQVELGVKKRQQRPKPSAEQRAPRKKRRLYQPRSDDDEEPPTSKSGPGIRKDNGSARPKSYEDRLMEQDDAEIDYWEAKLGQKKGAADDDFDDGLDDIFEGLSLPRGKSRLEEIDDDDLSHSDDNEGGSTTNELENSIYDEEPPELVEDLSDDFTRFDAEETESDVKAEEVSSAAAPLRASRPSIYLPFSETSVTTPQPAEAPSAYVPPALRNRQEDSIAHLTRQLKGLLNRLSTSNIGTIVSELETMYRSNPRGSMNEQLASLLLGIVSDKSGLLDSFVILHAALIAALYKSNGIEFAASFVQSLVETILAVQGLDLVRGRKAINLMTLLAELYNFNIIAATLPYDFIRALVADLNELNIEMLLVLIKSSGSELRSEDPSSLKDILTLLQHQIKVQYTDHGREMPLRMKFMVDTMMNLKNNKVANTTGQQAKELRTRMKKYIGSLTARAGSSGGEPLRVSLADIRNIETQGKWWLVGASWRNQETTTAEDLTDRDAQVSKPVVNDEVKEQELLALARQHRLNNPIRKQIFITILSASDYLEAITGVLSLRLKKSQESEITRVLLLLVASEERYNPYYTYIAKGLSDRHGMRISLQFCLWDFLRDCGEDEVGQIGRRSLDEEDDGGDSGDRSRPSLRKTINIAKFFGTLMGLQVMPLTVLKTLTFARLQSLTKRFLEVLLSELFLTIDKTATPATLKGTKNSAGREHEREVERKIAEAFAKVKKFNQENKNAALKDGIDWFLRKVVGKCAVVSGDDVKVVRDGVEVARLVLSL